MEKFLKFFHPFIVVFQNTDTTVRWGRAPAAATGKHAASGLADVVVRHTVTRTFPGIVVKIMTHWCISKRRSMNEFNLTVDLIVVQQLKIVMVVVGPQMILQLDGR